MKSKKKTMFLIQLYVELYLLFVADKIRLKQNLFYFLLLKNYVNI